MAQMTATSCARNLCALHAQAAIDMASDCPRDGYIVFSAPAPKGNNSSYHRKRLASHSRSKKASDLAMYRRLNTYVKLGCALVQGRVTSGTSVNSICKLFVEFTRSWAFGPLLSQHSELQRFVTEQRQVSRNAPARASVLRAIPARIW